MAEKWWFQSLGEELGPVDFADLVQAAQRGDLAKSDLVRSGENGSWEKAASVAGLFGERSVTPSAEANATAWMVQVLGEELGPLPLSELAAMFQATRLLPTDKIRRVDAQDWIPAARILEALEPSSGLSATSSNGAQEIGGSPSVATGQAGIDELESLILELMSDPVEVHAKPTLVELGLAEEKAAPPTPDIAPLPQAPAAVGGGVTYTRISQWLPLSVFRKNKGSAASDESFDATMAGPQGGSGALLLPPIERDFGGNSKAAVTEDEDAPERIRRGIPWLETLLFIAAASLVFQIFPNLWKSLTGYTWAFVGHLDVRFWVWKDWVIAEVVVVVLLVGITVWGKSGK